MTMAEAFEKRRDEVNDSAGSVMAAIEHNEVFDGSANDPGAELVEKIVAAILHQFDGRYGGFGTQPKFPHSAALDLLIDEAGREGPFSGAARQAAMVTLEKMSKGGMYDHLAGGFHRYSVDERWVVPHFEKMSYDNSELLKNYVHAFQTTGEPECARVARETMRWIDEWMSDRERGGFYASQDADFSLEDDGDYFTWTRAEVAAVLTAEEMAMAGPFFDVGELGDMHHNPEKNTLHVDRPLEMVSREAGVSVERGGELIASAKAKLYATRKLRPTPFVDRTVYVGWNSMMVSAYLCAGRVLGDREAREFALLSLDRMLQVAWDGEAGAMDHVVTYGEAGAEVRRAERVIGGLEDYVFAGHAALDGWECTGEMKYFRVAESIGDAAVTRFYDDEKGGFFDTERLVEGEVRLGALGARRKPLQDAPTPAGNSIAAALLLRLAQLNDRKDLQLRAQRTLECFAGMVEHLGLYAASFGLALRRFAMPGVQVVIVGADGLADELERASLHRFGVEKTVVRLPAVGELPSGLAETIPNLPPQTGSFAVVCRNFTCGLPIYSATGLADALVGAVTLR